MARVPGEKGNCYQYDRELSEVFQFSSRPGVNNSFNFPKLYKMVFQTERRIRVFGRSEKIHRQQKTSRVFTITLTFIILSI